MTDQVEHDIDGLLRKNAELLGQIKTLKGRITELEAERDTARTEAQTATDTMRRVQLDEPIEQALGNVFVAPWRVMKPLLEEHYTLALGDDGKPAITLKTTGEAVAFDGIIASMSAIPDLAAAIQPARGGGAPGNDPNGSYAGTKAKPTAVAGPFGLR